MGRLDTAGITGGETEMKTADRKLPSPVRWLLSRLTHRDDTENIVDTFEELYRETLSHRGKWMANLWIFLQVMKSIPGFLSAFFYWRFTMLKNYFTLSYRNFKKNKGYSFINIAGLTIGIACFFLITLWVQNELSYDNFHQKGDHIYRIQYQFKDGDHSNNISYALPPAIKKQFPEVLETTRVWPWHRSLVQYKDRHFEEDSFYLADPGFFKIFSFPFIHGDPETALINKSDIVLTKETAIRYFGSENPIGKVLHLGRHHTDFTVTGVVENIPANSHLRFDMVSRVEWLGEARLARWNESVAPAYALLHHTSDRDTVTEKIQALFKEKRPDSTVRPILQPLSRVHLYENGKPGLIINVYVFSILAVFILVMACINFMNLSTARSAHRAREVGMRKVVGATRKQIMRQFLGEAMSLTLLSMVMAVFIVWRLLPLFNQYSDQNITLFSVNQVSLFLIVLLTTIITGLLSGSYPAFFLSSFKPVETLRSNASTNGRGSLLRKSLIIFQFVISIGLIFSTLVVSKQLHYIRTRDMGFNREQIVTLKNNPVLGERIDSFKGELLRDGRIMNITASAQRPMEVGQTIPIDWEGNPAGEPVGISYTMVDYDFFKTFKIPVIQGRSFSKDHPVDGTNSCIINETAARLMGLDNPIGTPVKFLYNGIDPALRNMRIIGIAKDYHYQSVRRSIGPFLFRIYRPWHRFIFIKISPRQISDTISHIQRVFKQYAPDYPFWYEFMDTAFNRQYTSDIILKRLFNLFSLLSIIVSCLGLFGLASYSAEQKTREIGIRKILGSSVVGIISKMGRDFLKWILVSCLIAFPISYFLISQWLNNFVFKTVIGPRVFLLTIGFTLIFTCFTIGYRILKASTANPVDSLRYE